MTRSFFYSASAIVTLALSWGGAPSASSSQRRFVAPVTATIPFRIERLSGHRPVVIGSLGGSPYRFVIHSNAGFYVQTDHRHAALAQAYHLVHTGSYGIVASGQVSPLGRDEGVLPLLGVGRHMWHDVPVSIFETPSATTTGMLGIRWLAANNVVVDYRRNTITLHGDGISGKKSVPIGYQVLPMRFDESAGRYLVDVTIGQSLRPMVVSTVAGLTIDTTFAKEAGLGEGAISGEIGGPAGSVAYSHRLVRPVRLRIGKWISPPVQGEIEDIYAYMSKPRPVADAVGGMLGADFLIANAAIVDFGAKRLYLK